MGMVAILVMWPEPFEQTFVPSSHRSIWNLTLIDPVVSKKMFENVDNHKIWVTKVIEWQWPQERIFMYSFSLQYIPAFTS